MRRTFALFAVALASVAAAAMAALLRPGKPAPPPPPPAIASGGLRMQAVLERLYLPEDRATRAYLQIDLAADADGVARRERTWSGRWARRIAWRSSSSPATHRSCWPPRP